MAWTDETKAQAIKAYKDGNPTAENSTELVKEIAEDMEVSPNGVRAVLVQAGVYVKKEASDAKTKTAAKDGDKAPRVSKESQIAALKEAIEAKGAVADDEILTKLTGKAAAYFLTVLNA
jgi:transposase-like protein